ncbi:MAG: hypothetical protein PUK59_02570 [Actinomycetaceae bacterium]|nr:hypothetical protein [Actinomycetaceae bacterium]
MTVGIGHGFVDGGRARLVDGGVHEQALRKAQEKVDGRAWNGKTD